jgi:hypothetical protein
VKQILSHPVTLRTRRIARAILVTCSIILAVAFVTTLTVDLGPALKRQAEQQATNFMERPMHIGRLSVHLWRGSFVFEDLVIEGLTPQSRPFLVAERVDMSMPWSTLFSRRIVFDAIEMADWKMYVEYFPDGRISFPKLTPRGTRGPSAWTTTLDYVRAHRGEFAYQDHGTPWSTVARNLDVIVGRPTSEYRGRASFSNGTIKIQNYEPMRADMHTTFRIVDGKILLNRIDLTTDGAESVVTGEVDAAHWPEQTYQVTSTINFPRMREIFFARDTFSLFGNGGFQGTFHLFRETVNGRSRTGRELKGTFSSELAGVNAYRFGNLFGSLVWVPEKMEVTRASASFYGGEARFDYLMAPLGIPGVPVRHRFDAEYAGVDLTTYTNAFELEGLRLAGRATGRNLLEWPSGRWLDRRGGGTIGVEAPDGTELMTRQMPTARITAEAERGPLFGPFSNHTPLLPVPLGGSVSYTFTPGWLDLDRSAVATPDTYIEFEGRTAYGERSKLPFHVSSADWQESDRLLAGLMTALGSPTNAIPVGGYGTFDGVMVNSFRRPRIEGTFTGERMRAFDVVWGAATGAIVIENSYVDVMRAVIGGDDSTIFAEGRFSLGYPRRDEGEEINARIRVVRRPLVDLRHGFGLDDYDVDGRFSGEFHVYGHYLNPYGFGRMAITEGVAYGESFEDSAANVRLEGSGVRLDSIEVSKSTGRGTGAAYVGWSSGTYSFTFDARRIPVESTALATSSDLPLSGLLDFAATGSGTFVVPRYDVKGTIRDFFVADEGVGEVIGEIGIDGELMTLEFEAASPRLAVSGAGRIALTPEMDAEISFNVADTSLDPYVRAFEPRLSPFTTAVASGRIRVVGELADLDHLLVDATVDRLDVSLFDYRLRNATPIRVALDRHVVRVTEARMVGEDTQLDLSGVIDLHGDRIAVRANGDANLGILQGFVSNISSSGRAVLAATFEGTLREPLVTGTLSVQDGRIRHFLLPHGLEDISGPVRFDSRGISLDEVTASLGGGPVRFGGRIDIDEYSPGRLDVVMRGQNMRLRFPEGMRSIVDADLMVTGSVQAATLGGTVTVRSAVYTRRFDAGGGIFDVSGSAASGLGSTGSLEATIPLRYDVQLNAPSTVRIENNQARLQATADLQLRGTFDRPLLFGRAEIDRGEVTFEGRRYTIARGTIDFNNPTRIDPFFDVELETRVRVPGDTYRITLRAAGTFDRLTPVFNADPPLPEVEVLALLFSDVAPGQDVEFRQYSTGVTPQQQLLRERATRALTGAVSSEVGRVVEQTFGVDTFQLTPSLSDPNTQSSRLDPAARVTIGKRLSDRLYLTYSRSLSSSTRDQIILLEYDQTDRFSWILSRNEDRTYALDIRVRHAF